MRKANLRHLVGAVLAISSLSLAAQAADAPAMTPDGTFTMAGITLYGNVDVGLAYQSAGGPVSDYFPGGLYGAVQKYDYQNPVVIDGNNWSQSRIGLRGEEKFSDDLSGVFKVEMQFNPWSGQISDGVKSVVANNGLAVNTQTSGGDSSVAGQLFNGAAYAGLSSKTLGTVTAGRQTSTLADGIGKYDPLNTSIGFSAIGLQGTAAGAGDTEDRRLDDSVKYEITVNGVHFAAQYQPKTGANPGTTQGYTIGYATGGLSVDAYYLNKNDAIAAGSLSATDLSNIAKVCAGTAVANYACAPTDKAVSGTISDNTATAVMVKYAFPSKVHTISAGYEQIQWKNPSNAVSAGQMILNGYILGKVSNTGFPSTKQLDIYWIGDKFMINAKNDLYVAWYHYDQNQYATAAATITGCGTSSVSSSQCSGSEDFYSLVYLHHYSKRLDFYAGVMYSAVSGGLANGYTLATSSNLANATSSYNPTIGVNYKF